jgi:hypothetical protein
MGWGVLLARVSLTPLRDYIPKSTEKQELIWKHTLGM